MQLKGRDTNDNDGGIKDDRMKETEMTKKVRKWGEEGSEGTATISCSTRKLTNINIDSFCFIAEGECPPPLTSPPSGEIQALVHRGD